MNNTIESKGVFKPHKDCTQCWGKGYVTLLLPNLEKTRRPDDPTEMTSVEKYGGARAMTRRLAKADKSPYALHRAHNLECVCVLRRKYRK